MASRHLFNQPSGRTHHNPFRLNPDRELVFPDVWRKEDELMEADTGKGGTRK